MITIPKKRKSGGRAGGKRGKTGSVQCDNCSRTVPVDKVKRVTRYVSFVDSSIRKELIASGATLPRRAVTQKYCISCAIHSGQRKIRSKTHRKTDR